MIGKVKPDVDWSLTTWKGSRLQQHREFHALPFARKLEIMDDLRETIAAFKLPQPVKNHPPSAQK
jgi:hypothetical protein